MLSRLLHVITSCWSQSKAQLLPFDMVLCTFPPLVHMYAGAEFRHYTADITRTFPASGRFTPQQRDIYNLVLSLQEHALSLIKPGVAWCDIQQSTRLLLLEHLQQLGLVKGSVEAAATAEVDRVFMPHGLGHFLGLDVHDVSGQPMPHWFVSSCYPLLCFHEDRMTLSLICST
eukprot:GHUV01017896.1.p1 GENE.GHUV01017896.1~~GHUV01017896.1.p1  ORF type:complete len:173 (+),score=7.26 GHUV01017896.1:985-1503(+)